MPKGRKAIVYSPLPERLQSLDAFLQNHYPNIKPYYQGNERLYTLKELAFLFNKTENHLRVLVHNRNIKPITEKPNRYRIEDFQQTQNKEKIKSLNIEKQYFKLTQIVIQHQRIINALTAKIQTLLQHANS
jgi:hypothetical protein